MAKKKDSALPEYLTKKMVAERLSVSTKTVERMFNDGLKSFMIRGKRYVTASSLLDYIDQHRVGA